MPIRESSQNALEQNKRQTLEPAEAAVYKILLDGGPMHDQLILELLLKKEFAKPHKYRRHWDKGDVSARRGYCVTKGWVDDLGPHQGLWKGRKRTLHIWRASGDARQPEGWTKVKGQHVCRRCGLCCHNVSGSFWTNSEHPLIGQIYKMVKDYLPDQFFDDFGPCRMLITHGPTSTCLLQKYLGHNAKPKACRDYPNIGDNELCRREEEEKRLQAAARGPGTGEQSNFEF